MKNRILSSVLALVLTLTSLVAVFPISASAAEAEDSVTVTVGERGEVDAAQILKQYTNNIDEDYKHFYKYDTAEEMLKYDLENGYLDSIVSSEYAIYVNRYIGIVYYQNFITGQVLTSNPYDHKKTTDEKGNEFFSQIEIAYSSLSDASGNPSVIYSSEWIGKGFDLEVESMEDGIRVFYTLGYKVDEFLAPAAIMREDFDVLLAEPMFKKLADLMEKNLGPIAEEGIVTTRGTLKSYNLAVPEARRNGCYDKGRINPFLDAFLTYAAKCLDNNKDDPKYVEIQRLASNIRSIFTNYEIWSVQSLKNDDGTFINGQESEYKIWCETIPALADSDDAAVYIIDDHTQDTKYASVSSYIRSIFGKDISVDLIQEAVARTGYVSQLTSSAWFRCAVEYTLESDGALGVNVPASSIDYNDEYFSISSITPIKYFGCGNLYLDGQTTDGYGFIPDGSGAVVEFEDILTINANISFKVYGQDNCYSYLGTNKPNEQVVMPVYGIVNEERAGSTLAERADVETTTTGFFTVIESGASMASIAFTSSMSSGKFCFYNSYSPYPSDRYDLSQALSVGGTSYYNMVAKTKYEGDCKTRITMLTDDAVAQKLALTEYYPSTYVGMANCYKDYLRETGVIDDLVSAAEDLPLYIEALGSIDVVQKILTFPVTVSIPLTEFSDIENMYKDFINAAETLKTRAAEERAAAAELSADEEDQIRAHNKKAEKYEELAERVDSILNVNFKLTGFANGGMHFTYPAKLKWENSVGGKRGFTSLVEAAKSYNDNAEYNFGVYPDFDFLYISNTAAFDGIGLNRSAARFVDNRYASKQEWNSLVWTSTSKDTGGVFESTFSLLVTSNELDRLFEKFDKKYSKFDNPNLSVSTLGSDLNSNFDEDNPQNREQSLDYVKALLGKMANERNYSLMTDVGNIYSVQYVDHILNATIDSSHLKTASYTVPFYGLVLHGYRNYAGTPINYSGSPDYDILRAIENGASIYYVLCCQNTNKLKEDPELSKYYGIDYYNWFEKILVQYKTLNDAIGSLQNYEIVDHKTLIAERIIDSKDTKANFDSLVKELVGTLDVKLRKMLDDALLAIRQSGSYSSYVGKKVYIHLDVEKIAKEACVEFNLDEEALDDHGFSTLLDAVIKTYEGEGYVVDTETMLTGELNHINFTWDDMLDDGSYVSKYDYVTDSAATDKDYDYTSFTCDNGNVVMVKYASHSGEEEVFFLNYNMFAVHITIDNNIDKTLADGEKITLEVRGQDFLKLSDAKTN